MDSQHADNEIEKELQEEKGTVLKALEEIDFVINTCLHFMEPSRREEMLKLIEQEKVDKNEQAKSLEAKISKLKKERQLRVVEDAKIRREQGTFAN
jgi:predicted secreted protein